tara:strand:- start:1018 stop:1305 length:288 start_codon:yes stop_codon:yes gene_type:complete
MTTKTYTCAITGEELPIGTNAKLVSSKLIDSTLLLEMRAKFDDLEDATNYLNSLDDKRTFKYVPASDDYSDNIFVEFVQWYNVSHKAFIETYDKL